LAKRILNSVTDYMEHHDEARFTWSDHSFFRKWFNEEVKGKGEKESKVRDLIQKGHLDLINGGLVQNDEASPHMKETFTNLEEGLKFLFEEFGIRPDSYWQLDPFGFSSVSPEIYKSVGIDKVVLNRMSDAYKDVLRKNQDLDFIWQGDGEEEIWTHTLHGHYGIDNNFYFDRRWGASNKCPNPLDERCVKKLVEELIHQGMKVHNRTGYVMQLLGNDFFFTDAQYSFDYINGMKTSLEKYGPNFLKGKPVEFRFATLTEYLKEMEHLRYEIGRYRGDFFVYTQYHEGNYHDHHWGGYFFSRPMFKWMVRDSMSRERLLHSMIATMNFLSFPKETNVNRDELNKAYHTLLNVKEFNPVLLHHDAITGTHGRTVNNDYKKILQNLHKNMDTATNQLIYSLQSPKDLKNNRREKPSYEPNKYSTIVMHNPSFYTRNEIINVTLPSGHWSFINTDHPTAEIMDSYKLDGERFTQDTREFTLWIKVSIPPFGHENIPIEKHENRDQCRRAGRCIPKIKTENLGTISSDLTLSNSHASAGLGKNTLEIKHFTDKDTGQKMQVNEALYKYDAQSTHSCIYMFKPTRHATEIHLNQQQYLKYNGSLVTGYQVYGQDNDIHFDKTVLLKENDSALHVVLRNNIRQGRNKEISIRYQGYEANEFYSGDSMAYINRKFIDLETAKARNLTRQGSHSDTDLLGLNTYPIVDGFVSKNGGYIGFSPSQSAGVNLLSDSAFEFLIARSIMNINQEKGLPERLDDHLTTHFNYKVFMAKNLEKIHNKSHVYGDQMVDPIFVIKNDGQKVIEIPKISFDETENVGIDVISFRNFNYTSPIQSPGMIRLRNRSHKPIRLNPILFSYEEANSTRGHIAIMSGTRYGYSHAETLKNLNYEQKVSKRWNVKDDHNVLKGYRDDFVTIENKLREIHGNQTLAGLALYDKVLQPSEISHFMLYYGEFDKTDEKQKIIGNHLERISKEEELREKAYERGKKSDLG